MQRVRQKPQPPAHFGHFQPFIKQPLGLRTYFGGQLVAYPPRGRGKKGAHPAVAIKLDVALHRHQRYPKGTGDLGLGSVAIDDQLAAEHPKGRQIARFMDEDRQMAVEVAHLARLALKGQFRSDGGDPFGKDRQLHLWHPSSVAKTRPKITPRLGQKRLS